DFANARPFESKLQWLREELEIQLAPVNGRYQRFVKNHIDPLLGRSRETGRQETSYSKRWSIFDQVVLSRNGSGVTSGSKSIKVSSPEGEWQLLRQDIETQILALDERYQRFVHTHIDPLIGRSRQAE